MKSGPTLKGCTRSPRRRSVSRRPRVTVVFPTPLPTPATTSAGITGDPGRGDGPRGRAARRSRGIGTADRSTKRRNHRGLPSKTGQKHSSPRRGPRGVAADSHRLPFAPRRSAPGTPSGAADHNKPPQTRQAGPTAGSPPFRSARPEAGAWNSPSQGRLGREVSSPRCPCRVDEPARRAPERGQRAPRAPTSGGFDEMLTPEQVQAYRRDGYLVVENVLTSRELATLHQVIETLVAGLARGHRPQPHLRPRADPLGR